MEDDLSVCNFLVHFVTFVLSFSLAVRFAFNPYPFFFRLNVVVRNVVIYDTIGSHVSRPTPVSIPSVVVAGPTPVSIPTVVVVVVVVVVAAVVVVVAALPSPALVAGGLFPLLASWLSPGGFGGSLVCVCLSVPTTLVVITRPLHGC